MNDFISALKINPKNFEALSYQKQLLPMNKKNKTQIFIEPNLPNALYWMYNILFKK